MRRPRWKNTAANLRPPLATKREPCIDIASDGKVQPDGNLGVWHPFLGRLLLRVLVRALCGSGILTVVQGRGGVLLRFVVVAMIVIIGGLAVVMRRGLMVRGGVVMVFARTVFLFFLPLEMTPARDGEDASGQGARRRAVMPSILS